MLQASQQRNNVGKAKLMREDSLDSTTFYESDTYQVISDFHDFVSWLDRRGNTVAHHLAMADMQRSLGVLYAENKELCWVENDSFETPQTVCDGLGALTPRQLALHRALHDGCLLQTGSAPVPAILIRTALRWPEEDDSDGGQSAPEVRQMEDSLTKGLADEVLVAKPPRWLKGVCTLHWQSLSSSTAPSKSSSRSDNTWKRFSRTARLLSALCSTTSASASINSKRLCIFDHHQALCVVSALRCSCFRSTLAETTTR